jgi:enamine deaminase RidA (YjgF/YER057c/UK114 family)
VSDGAARGAPRTNSDRLAALGLRLPDVVAPVAAYVPAVRDGGLVHVSGQLPMIAGALPATGLVGEGPDEVAPARAAELARAAALNVLAAAAQVAGGLDRLDRIVRVGVMVACAPGFTAPHTVANGASELFGAVLAPGVGHARAAYGVTRLPLDAPVEVEAIIRLVEDDALTDIEVKE